MLDVYSLNVIVGSTATIPFNNTNLVKGNTAILTAPGSIQLNKRGVYMVECDASVVPSAAGTASIQLTKDGALQQQAQSSVTGTAGAISTLGFHTLVPVRQDNTCCCFTSPVTLQVLNTGVASTFNNISLTVTKIC